MARLNPYLLVFSAVISGASVTTQAAQSASSSHARTVPAPLDVDEASTAHGKEIPGHVYSRGNLPFSIDNSSGESARYVRVLSEVEMSREDRDLVADAQASIQEKAGFSNLEFDGEGWTYRQLVCPAMPKHLFLRFTRGDGTREMSMFSAAIPRDGNGRVHIIPIVRKGYSLFSPAPIGAMTIAAFNRIRSEEGADAPADWLGTGLCYAALSGGNPQIGEEMEESSEGHLTFPPTLAINAEGAAVISFVDVSNKAKPMEWTMTFNPKGKLLKAEHSPAYVGHVEKSKASVQDPDQGKP